MQEQDVSIMLSRKYVK